jgi:hypothetical protein
MERQIAQQKTPVLRFGACRKRLREDGSQNLWQQKGFSKGWRLWLGAGQGAVGPVVLIEERASASQGATGKNFPEGFGCDRASGYGIWVCP